MPIKWFDIPENNAGKLAARLSVDCSTINSLVSNVVAINVQSMGSFLTGMTIAFTASWSLTLVMIAVSPLLIISWKI